jgi:hypothetical protein
VRFQLFSLALFPLLMLLLRAETPAAVIRPQLQPKGDLLPGADLRRLCVQGFIDASLPYGPGVTVAPPDAFLLRLDLGDPAFECLGNDQNYKEVSKSQNGEKEFRFRYSLCGHKGPYNQAAAVAWSRDVATPLLPVTRGFIDPSPFFDPSPSARGGITVPGCVLPLSLHELDTTSLKNVDSWKDSHDLLSESCAQWG